MLFAKIPSAAFPVIVPVAVIDKLPVPESSTRIPLAEPVTAFVVREIVDP